MNGRVESFHVVVVGAGLAGLPARTTVSAGGASVVVLEVHRPGGRARTLSRERFVFDHGARALYRGGPGYAVLASLGVHPKGAPRPLGRYRLSVDGELHAMLVWLGSLVTKTALGARDMVQLARCSWPGCELEVWPIARGRWLADLGLQPDAEGSQPDRSS